MITLDADEVETAPQQGQKAPPRPATHVFSASTWLRANPGGDIRRATAKAKDLGFEVTK
jgi:hypothetical protein